MVAQGLKVSEERCIMASTTMQFYALLFLQQIAAEKLALHRQSLKYGASLLGFRRGSI